MYMVMRKIPAYKVKDFFDESFMLSQFIALQELIKQENDAEQKAYKEANKKSKRGKK